MLTPSTSSFDEFDCEIGLIRNYETMTSYNLTVKGMTCGACSSSIESTLKSSIDPSILKSVHIDLLESSVIVKGSAELKVDEVVRLIKEAGFTVAGSSSDWRGKLESRRRVELEEFREVKKRFLKILFFSLPVVLTPHQYKLVSLIFSIPLHLYAASYIYKSAFFTKSCNMERLIALNCIASLLYSLILRQQHGMFDCTAWVLIFYSGGKLLENVLKRRITADPDDLLIPIPKIVKSNGISVPIKDLKVGNFIDLNTGDVIPFDGVIMLIKSSGLFVNESTLTGEPLAKRKSVDEVLMAGSRVESGSAVMKITKSLDDSFINKLARGIYDKPDCNDSEEGEYDTIEMIAKWFIPIIIGLAIFTFILWMTVFKLSGAQPRDLIPEWRNIHKYPSTPLAASIFFSLTVLCVACPCSLTIAAPIAIASIKASCLRRGILIRDTRAFSKAPEIDILLFDKTGTLTSGKPVVSFEDCDGFENWMLSACKLIEEKLLKDLDQEHFIAKSIFNYCKSRETVPEKIQLIEVKGVLGQGVIGRIERSGLEHVIKIIKTPESKMSSSTIFVDERIVGKFYWFDELKFAALDVVNFFKLSLNLRLGIISGDSQGATERIAAQFLPGTFSYVLGNCLPEDKSRIVDDLRLQGFNVCFCGDGLNDSLAMSRANMSISLDPTSTHATVNIIKTDNLTSLPEVFRSSRRLNRQIIINTAWALIYNTVTIPLAMGAPIPLGIKPFGPEIGIVLMFLSSTLIIFTSIIFIL